MFLPYLLLYFHLCQSFNVKSALENAEDGTTISIPAGIHYMGYTYLGGKKNLRVVGETGSVLECGNQAIIENSVTWLQQNDYWYTEEFDHNNCDTNNIFVSVGQRVFDVTRGRGSLYKRNLLWVYKNFVDFQSRFAGDGVFFDNSASPKRLYVFYEDGLNPSDLRQSFRVLNVGCGRCLQIEYCESLHFENFVIENGGNQLVYVRDSHDITFKKVEFLGAMEQVKFAGGVYNTLVDECKLMNFYNLDWVWGHVKNDPEYELLMGPAIMRYQGVGGGHVIRNSDISGNFDGIQFWGTGGSCHSTSSLGVEISGNRVYNILDDAIEVEGGCNENVQVFGNVVYNVFCAVALAPAYPGPVYVYENLLFSSLVINFQAFGQEMMGPKTFKMSCNCDGTPPQNVKIYHNTLITKYGQLYHGNYPPGDQIRDFEVVNNIMYLIFNPTSSYDCAQYLLHHPGYYSDGNNVYNSNLYFVENWDETHYVNSLFHKMNGYSGNSLEEFKMTPEGQSCAWEENGMEANPMLIMDDWDFPTKYELLDGSPARGSAVALDSTWPKDEYLQDGLGNDIGVNFHRFEVYDVPKFISDLEICDEDDELNDDEGRTGNAGGVAVGVFTGTTVGFGALVVVEGVVILFLCVVVGVLLMKRGNASKEGPNDEMKEMME